MSLPHGLGEKDGYYKVQVEPGDYVGPSDNAYTDLEASFRRVRRERDRALDQKNDIAEQRDGAMREIERLKAQIATMDKVILKTAGEIQVLAKEISTEFNLQYNAGWKAGCTATAYDIRAELVCCDVYNEESIKDKPNYRHHDLCYWGEASAGIAEDMGTKDPSEIPWYKKNGTQARANRAEFLPGSVGGAEQRGRRRRPQQEPPGVDEDVEEVGR